MAVNDRQKLIVRAIYHYVKKNTSWSSDMGRIEEADTPAEIEIDGVIDLAELADVIDKALMSGKP